jgi:hypothetical protein
MARGSGLNGTALSAKQPDPRHSRFVINPEKSAPACYAVDCGVQAVGK